MNTNLLRAKMVEKGLTQKELAAAIGLSENSVSRKLTGKRDFSIQEALKICEVLSLENPNEIFFANLSHISNDN
ncbi:MAG: helix-turn-helix transcriptional regulator [Clostridiales bacterium]